LPDVLDSNILTKQVSGTGALTITVNETGLIHPESQLISSFSNLNQGTDHMRTSLNSSLLASANLSGLSVAGPFTDSVVTGSPYSVHEQYQVNAAPGKLNNSAIDLQIQATPVPGALGLFASGLGLLGFWGFKRARKTEANSLGVLAS
jgi:lysozyme family protein